MCRGRVNGAFYRCFRGFNRCCYYYYYFIIWVVFFVSFVGVVRAAGFETTTWYDECGARAVAYDKKPVPRRDLDAAWQRERWWSAVMCAANEPCCRRTCGWLSCCCAPRPRCRPAELPRRRTSTANEVRVHNSDWYNLSTR